MAIKDDKEFEERLLQLGRFYRAMREIWGKTNVEDQSQVGRWVVTGRRVIAKITDIIAELEDYTGSSELRLIVEEMEKVRQARESQADRT